MGDEHRRKLGRIDPGINRVVANIPVGPAPRFLAVGEGPVWTLNQTDGSVSRIDPYQNKVIQQFKGKGGDAIRAGLGSVWLSNLRAGAVWRLDPKRIAATAAP